MVSYTNTLENENSWKLSNIVNIILYYFSPILAFIIFSFPEIFNGNAYLILGIALVSPYGINYISKKKKYIRCPLFFLFYVFFGSLMNLLNTSNSIGGSILLFGVFFLALFFIENVKTGMIMSALYLIYLYLFLYKNIFIEGTDPNFIYEELGLSRNHPGCLIVSFLCFYAFLKYMVMGKLPLILPILGVILTFSLEGRSSFGVTIAFVCLVFRSSKKSHLIFYLFLLIGVLSYFWEDLMGFYTLSRLSEKGTDNSARDVIWSAYFSNIDLFSCILGLDAENVKGLSVYGGNPHNSFLNFHRRMGLIGLLALLWIMVFSIKKYLKNKQYIPIIFIFLYIVRIFFDTVLVSTFDFIFFTMLFYSTIKGIDFYPYKKLVPSRNIFKKTFYGIINVL